MINRKTILGVILIFLVINSIVLFRFSIPGFASDRIVFDQGIETETFAKDYDDIGVFENYKVLLEENLEIGGYTVEIDIFDNDQQIGAISKEALPAPSDLLLVHNQGLFVHEILPTGEFITLYDFNAEIITQFPYQLVGSYQFPENSVIYPTLSMY